MKVNLMEVHELLHSFSFLFCRSSFCVLLVLNLVPIALHLIWEIYIYNIYECFPIIPFKRLAIVFLIILGSTRSNKKKKLAFALDLPILSSLLAKPSSLQNPNSKGLIQNVMMGLSILHQNDNLRSYEGGEHDTHDQEGEMCDYKQHLSLPSFLSLSHFLYAFVSHN